MTPLEMLLGAVGAKDDPELRRPADAVALGPHAPQHPVAGQPDRHAVPAGRRLRRSRDALRAHHRHSRSRRALPRRRDHLPVDRRRRDERRRVLGVAQHRLHAPVPVLYLVEDNGYAISVPVEVQTPGGDISRLVESFPNLKVLRCDGTDFLDSYRTLGEAVAWVRRERKPAFVHAKVIRPVLALAVGRRAAVQDAGGARGRGAARSAHEDARVPARREDWPPRRDLEAIAADVDREIAEATDAGARGAEAGARHRRLVRLLARRRSDLGRVRDAGAAGGQARHDGGRHQPHAEGRDGAQPAHRRLRRGRRRREQGRGAAARARQGRRLQGDARPAAAYGADRVFNSPLAEANIVGRAVGMATRGLKPVVEIQFFDYIWPAMMQIKDEMSMLRYRSANNFSCPMVIRVPIGGYLRGGAPYHSQSGVSIFAHCPGIRIVFPSQRRRRRRAAAHVDPLRRPGDVPRAQAPLSPDLQQGRLPGRRAT